MMGERDPYVWFDPFAARQTADYLDERLERFEYDARRREQELEQRAAYYKGRSDALDKHMSLLAMALPLRHMAPTAAPVPAVTAESSIKARDEEPWRC